MTAERDAMMLRNAALRQELELEQQRKKQLLVETDALTKALAAAAGGEGRWVRFVRRT